MGRELLSDGRGEETEGVLEEEVTNHSSVEYR
jgi:hypothetical protein